LCFSRWAVAVRPNNYLELQLQSLPAPANVVDSRPVLRVDNVAVQVLQSWAITTDFFDGEGQVCGPVPTLFAEDLEAARTKLDEEKAAFGADLNNFMRR
jgi:hypothetical protein